LDIAKEVYKKTQEFNVPETELLVEIDFFGDAPALRNEFKVWLTPGFLAGSSIADAPGWFHIHSEKKTIVRILRQHYEQVKSDNSLVICRAGNGIVSVSCMYSLGAMTGCQRLSDEAVEAIGTEDYDWMVANLGQDTTDEYSKEKGVA
jgi:hypothetical protein